MKTLSSLYPFNLQPSPEQYRKVFFTAISFFGGTFFLIFGSGSEQNWECSDLDLDTYHPVGKADAWNSSKEHCIVKAIEQETSPLLNYNPIAIRDYRGTKSS